MKESATKISGKYVLLIQADTTLGKTKEVYFFLHGVPAIGYKNEDIARAVTAHTGQDSIVIHYRGLGNSTEGSIIRDFDFTESVKDSIEYAAMLAGQYSIIHVVGHSWGGCIALNIFRQLKPEQRGQLVLLAPFTEFPKDGSVEAWLVPMSADGRIPLRMGLDARTNFFEVEKIYPPKQDISKICSKNNQVFLIEAKDDPDVPNQHTEILYQLLLKNPFQIGRCFLADDHLFKSDRPALIQCILKAIDLFHKRLFMHT